MYIFPSMFDDFVTRTTDEFNFLICDWWITFERHCNNNTQRRRTEKERRRRDCIAAKNVQRFIIVLRIFLC